MNDPSVPRVKFPCSGPATCTAVSESPSASVSLWRRPGAAIVSAVTSFGLVESSVATGAGLGGWGMVTRPAGGCEHDGDGDDAARRGVQCRRDADEGVGSVHERQERRRQRRDLGPVDADNLLKDAGDVE